MKGGKKAERRKRRKKRKREMKGLKENKRNGAGRKILMKEMEGRKKEVRKQSSGRKGKK
ncbi:MAG: hypothetical protein ACRCU6_10455 [Fusobacteriaceae bacterium]